MCLKAENVTETIDINIIEGSLETKVPTVWKNEKHSQDEAEAGRNSDGEKARRETIRDGESQKRKDAGARKGTKVQKSVFFPLFCGSGGSKRRLAKAAGAEPARQMKDERFARRYGAKHISK